jgi:polar amino acid transport system substrate-binding protein
MIVYGKNIFFLLAILVITLTSCRDNKDKLIVGTTIDNPPFSFVVANQIVGIDISIIREIEKKLDKQMIIKDMSFVELLDSVAAGKVDLAISSITVNPERKKLVDFSIPYTSSVMTLVYKSNNHIKDLSDIEGRILGTLKGTTIAQFAHFITIIFNCDVVEFDNNKDLVLALNTGAVNVIIVEEEVALNIVANYTDLHSMKINNAKSDFAIALPKKSSLTKDIDSIITVIKNDGTISKIKKRWLDNPNLMKWQ